LDLIFCRKEKRKISPTERFSYEGETYVLKEENKYKFSSIKINTHVDGRVIYDIVGRPVRVIRASEKSLAINKNYDRI
jgi:hypothetical protein